MSQPNRFVADFYLGGGFLACQDGKSVSFIRGEGFQFTFACVNLEAGNTNKSVKLRYCNGPFLPLSILSRNRRRLAVHEIGGGIFQLHDLNTSRKQARVEVPSDCFIFLAFSTDSRWLASITSNWGIKLWNVSSGEVIAKLSVERDDIF